MEGNAPVTAILWENFIMNPTLMPGLFKNTPGEVTPDGNKVTVVEQGRDNPKSGVFDVTTQEELDDLVNTILTKPLFTKVYLSHQQTHSSHTGRVDVMEINSWIGHYAVLFNTAHPDIKKQIEPSLRRAQERMKKGKKFCVEINFGDALVKWYTDRLHARMVSWNMNWATVCYFAAFNITNTSIYNRCFDCNILWCMCCCICWLLSAPCYKCHRSCTTEDIRIPVSCKITTKELVVASQAAHVITKQN